MLATTLYLYNLWLPKMVSKFFWCHFGSWKIKFKPQRERKQFYSQRLCVSTMMIKVKTRRDRIKNQTKWERSIQEWKTGGKMRDQEICHSRQLKKVTASKARYNLTRVG